MLLDWITARVPCTAWGEVPEADWVHTFSWAASRWGGNLVVEVDSATGEVVWSSRRWDSVASDSHRVAFRFGSDAFWIQGSPARACGDQVWGAGPSRVLDIWGSLEVMVSVVRELGIPVPAVSEEWIVTRVDVTSHVALRDLASVRVGLRVLQGTEGGRYRVSQVAGSTVYWSHRSRLLSGKAYAKGPEVRRRLRAADYSGPRYSDAELEELDCLLRCELRVGAQWFRERAGCGWWEIEPVLLVSLWEGYFGRMLGDSEVEMSSVEDRIEEAAGKPRLSRAVKGTWALVQLYGYDGARARLSESTWHRHLRVLRAAGLGDADISAGQVVVLRRAALVSSVVHSVEELRAVRRAA